MNATFGQLLRNELVKLSDAVCLQSYRDRSRRQSSGSGVSVDTVVGDIIPDRYCILDPSFVRYLIAEVFKIVVPNDSIGYFESEFP